MNLAEAIARVSGMEAEPSDQELGEILGATMSGIVRSAAIIAAGSVCSSTDPQDVVNVAKGFEQYILTGE